MEDGEIFGAGDAIYGRQFTLRRLNIHDSKGDGVKISGDNTVVEDCYIHSLGTAEGAHADGIQIMKGVNHVIRGNNIDMPIGQSGYRSNAALFINGAFGPIDNVLIEDNWLNGGNYTIKVNATNATVRNNFFGRDYRYGIDSTNDAYPLIWENNRWEDTGALIS